MNISIVTTARTDEEGRALLRQFGMPFMNSLVVLNTDDEDDGKNIFNV